VLAAAAFVLLRVPAVQDALIRRGARAALTASPDLFEPDALRVLVCGSVGPLPHPTRAGPCTAIFAGGRLYLVDAGLGGWDNLARWRVDGRRIAAVLLTHFHSDHIGELGEIDLQTWVAGRDAPLRVLGPPGVENVVAGFEEAYAHDARYRIAHHGADLLPEAAGRMRPTPVAPGVVLEENDLRITAFPVDHAPVEPAYGYRFDYRGRSVVVSGDGATSDTLTEAAKDADVLVRNVLAKHLVSLLEEVATESHRPRIAKIMSDIPSYHASPEEAARTANEAGVRLLVLSHLTPLPPPPLERAFTRGVDAVRPDGWAMGRDGLLVKLPADSEAIRTDHLD